jgi:adenosylmethionine-8-amino-7-oxononanoate aminotransferase
MADTENARTTVVHRYWHTTAPIIDRGEGLYLWDKDGNRYLDGAAGSSVVVNIGHGVQSVVDAIYEQGKKVSFASPHVFTNEKLLELGPMVTERAPGEMRDHCRVWFSNTGTDSVDDAARLARQYWVARGEGSKYLLISRWQGFHGNNLAVAGFSGHTFRRRLYYPMFVHTPHIPAAYCYRCPFELEQPTCRLKCARSLETMINQIGSENVAAFIAEPVVGAALGCVPAPEGYFEIVRDICDRHNVLLIADEVMTAWGRIGHWFGIDEWGVTPDIIATAKGITSGYATLAATLGREDIWQTIEESGTPFVAGHTMNQNPISAAAAVANLRYMEEQDLLTNSREVGAYLLERLGELREFAIIGDVRGLGMMCGIELVKDPETKEPFAPEQKASVVLEREALKRGLILYACSGCIEGAAGDMLEVTPPLVMTREQVDEMMDILHEAIPATKEALMG